MSEFKDLGKRHLYEGIDDSIVDAHENGFISELSAPCKHCGRKVYVFVVPDEFGPAVSKIVARLTQRPGTSCQTPEQN